MLPSPSMPKTTIGSSLSMHRLNAAASTTRRPLLQRLGVGDLVELDRVRVGARVGGVDAVDAVLAHQDHVALDLQRALGRDGVGGEVRHAGAGAEDDDAALLQVPDGAARDVRLGDLAHRDGGLHPGVDRPPSPGSPAAPGSSSRCRACPCSRRGRGPCPAAAARRRGRSCRRRRRRRPGRRSLTAAAICSRDHADDVGVEADLPAAEHLAGELEQHPLVRRVRGVSGHRGLQGKVVRRSVDLSTGRPGTGHGPVGAAPAPAAHTLADSASSTVS